MLHNETLKNKTRREENFAANVCTCLVLWKQNVGGGRNQKKEEDKHELHRVILRNRWRMQ